MRYSADLFHHSRGAQAAFITVGPSPVPDVDRKVTDAQDSSDLSLYGPDRTRVCMLSGRRLSSRRTTSRACSAALARGEVPSETSRDVAVVAVPVSSRGRVGARLAVTSRWLGRSLASCWVICRSGRCRWVQISIDPAFDEISADDQPRSVLQRGLISTRHQHMTATGRLQAAAVIGQR